MNYFKLKNGVDIPQLGLGTSHAGGYSHEAVVYALKDVGYRLIDTAKRYGNEHLLGRAIEESQIPRANLFLTSKVWPTDFGSPENVENAFAKSAKKLGTDYLDLYLVHWPLVPTGTPNRLGVLEEVWHTLEKLYEKEKCRAVGVSNFNIEELNHIIDHGSVVPHLLQSEFHVHCTNHEVRTFCDEKQIQFEGYCPLARGTVFDEPTVVELANVYKRTAAQILLRWSVQSGAVTIPKSTNHNRLKQNLEIFDFELSPDDMARLDGLNQDKPCLGREYCQRDIDLPDGHRLNAKD